MAAHSGFMLRAQKEGIQDLNLVKGVLMALRQFAVSLESPPQPSNIPQTKEAETT
jgi:hypothetical protein